MGFSYHRGSGGGKAYVQNEGRDSGGVEGLHLQILGGQRPKMSNLGVAGCMLKTKTEEVAQLSKSVNFKHSTVF